MIADRLASELFAALAAAEDDTATPRERAEMLMEIAIGLQQRPKTPEHIAGAIALYDRAIGVCPEEERLLRARIAARRGTALQAMPEDGTASLEAARRDYDEAIPALAELAGMIGDPAVRHRGTIGGSLANNDPTADYPAACLALGATIVTNKRRLKPEEFFQGLFTTALESDEIITKVMFPLPKKAAYIKFRNQASRYALVGVFVARRPSDVRVAVTGAGSDGVFRVTAFEEALKKRFSPKALDGLTVPADGLNSDLHGSAEYRAHLISVLARRAVAAATGKA